MPDTHLIVIGGWLITAIAFAVGYVACAVITRDRQRLDALALAERADANGKRLLVIARSLRDTPADEFARQDLDRWANDLEDAAIAHLQCINAIELGLLQAVGYRDPWLGEFRAGPGDPPERSPVPERERRHG